MSEYAGELKVKLVIDGSDVPQQVNQQMQGVSPRVRSLLQRSGLDKGLESYRQKAGQVIAVNKQLAQAEDVVATKAMAQGRAMGLLGIAAVAGYQAINQLQQSLRVTGAEAGTTEGRLRNVGAALLGGDVIGAFKAARVEFTLTAQALNDLQAQLAKGDSTNIDKLRQAVEVFGNEKLRAQLTQASYAVRANLQADKATAAGLTPGLRDDLEVARTAEREAAIGLRIFEKGTEAYSKAFAGWAAAVKRRRAIVESIESKNLTPEQQDSARATQYQLNQLRAAATKQQRDDQDIARTRRDSLQKQIDVLEQDKTKTTAQKQRLVTLYGQLDAVEKSLEQTRTEARQAEQDRIMRRLELAQLDLQIEAANARGQAQETAALQDQAALARKAAQTKGLTIEQRKQYELQAAQLDKQLYDIGQQQAEQAKQAAADAARAKQEEIDAEKQRYRETLSLEEQRLKLREQAAQLTKTKRDDRKVLKDEIAFYKDEERDMKLTLRERLTAQSNKISTQLQLRDLAKKKPKTEGTQRGATTAEFFSEAASTFSQYGSNITGAGGILSGQDARAAFAARALSGRTGQSFAQAVERARSNQALAHLTEAQKQTAILTGILNAVGGKPTKTTQDRKPSDFAIKAARVGVGAGTGM